MHMTSTGSPFASTPTPPYYAVIFTSQRSSQDHDGAYDQMAQRMVQLASTQPGFLGVETVRGQNGFGITVSYWSSEEAISNWKAHLEHQSAQKAGKNIWYADYQLRIAKVERAYGKASLADEARSSALKASPPIPST